MNVKELSNEELRTLADQIRYEILQEVSLNGGHLSSNLAVVEATIALFKVFDFPNDSLIFDVGHQCYTYKILSDRSLENLRRDEGVSGFQNIKESIYDYYDAGHSSTSLPIAIGRAISFKLKNESRQSIAFIGDGSLGNGLSLEAINHLSTLDCKVIIVVNDNNMAITQTVGGIQHVLSSDKMYKLFEDSNITYINNVDGHDFNSLIDAFGLAKVSPNSVIIHIKTIKGKGYKYSEEDHVGIYHKVGKFDIEKGAKVSKNTTFVSYSINRVLEKMRIDPSIVVVVPATNASSDILEIKKEFPSRFYDVGMAEEYALLFAQGLATNNLHPYVFIKSTFLQRCYDELLHDISRNKFNITIIVENIGISRGDGATHQGIYDLGFLYSIPELKIATPSNKKELDELLDISNNEPLIIRLLNDKLEENKHYYLHNPSHDTVIISYGPIIHQLVKEYEDKADILNVLYQSPLDKTLLRKFEQRYKKVIIFDRYGTKEGFAKEIIQILSDLHYPGNIYTLALENKFYDVRNNTKVTVDTSRIKIYLER